MFTELGSFVITREQRECYKTGDLWREWLKQYPELFDAKDEQYFRNQGVKGYGFVEALSVIFLYNATGYMPILGNFGWQTQQRKNNLVKRVVPEEIWAMLTDMKTYHSIPPDLFAFSPDKTDYFFCEVKGPGDRLRDTQIQYFGALQKLSGKSVYTVKYRFAPFSK